MLAAEIDAFKRCRSQQRLETPWFACAKTLAQQRAGIRFARRVAERPDDATHERCIVLADAHFEAHDTVSLQPAPVGRKRLFFGGRHKAIFQFPEVYPETGTMPRDPITPRLRLRAISGLPRSATARRRWCP